MIYLDNNATTIISPEVQQVFIDTLALGPINPSSAHSLGRRGKELLLDAKYAISSYLGVKPDEIYFTSGATEGLNLLLKGFDLGSKTILTSNAEHAAIEKILGHLKNPIIHIPVGFSGAPCPYLIEEELQKNPSIGLIILSSVYTETGAKLALDHVAKLALHYNVPFFLDAVGIIGKENFTIPLGVTGAVFSGHKFHGPQGVGAIFLRASQKLIPLLHGGGQQKSLRSGTENVAGIVGFAKAFTLLQTALPEATKRMETLRNQLEQNLAHLASVNGQAVRICNTSNLYFPQIDGETLLIMLDQMGVIASLGSACASGGLSPSHVLQNMGFSYSHAKNSLRFSLSRYTTFEEINKASNIIKEIIQEVMAATSIQ